MTEGYIKSVHSVTANTGDSWSVVESKEIKSIELFFDDDMHCYIFIVKFQSNRKLRIPFHSISYWME